MLDLAALPAPDLLDLGSRTYQVVCRRCGSGGPKWYTRAGAVNGWNGIMRRLSNSIKVRGTVK